MMFGSKSKGDHHLLQCHWEPKETLKHLLLFNIYDWQFLINNLFFCSIQTMNPINGCWWYAHIGCLGCHTMSTWSCKSIGKNDVNVRLLVNCQEVTKEVITKSAQLFSNPSSFWNNHVDWILRSSSQPIKQVTQRPGLSSEAVWWTSQAYLRLFPGIVTQSH